MTESKGGKGHGRCGKGQSKGNKGQGRRGRGQARGNGARPRARHKPATLRSWEALNESAMAEYLEAVREDFAEQLDVLEEALRSEN